MTFVLESRFLLWESAAILNLNLTLALQPKIQCEKLENTQGEFFSFN